MEDIIDYKEDPVPEKGGRKWIAGMMDAIVGTLSCQFCVGYSSRTIGVGGISTI